MVYCFPKVHSTVQVGKHFTACFFFLFFFSATAMKHGTYVYKHHPASISEAAAILYSFPTCLAKFCSLNLTQTALTTPKHRTVPSLTSVHLCLALNNFLFQHICCLATTFKAQKQLCCSNLATYNLN